MPLALTKYPLLSMLPWTSNVMEGPIWTEKASTVSDAGSKAALGGTDATGALGTLDFFFFATGSPGVSPAPMWNLTALTGNGLSPAEDCIMNGVVIPVPWKSCTPAREWNPNA